MIITDTRKTYVKSTSKTKDHLLNMVLSLSNETSKVENNYSKK